MKAILLLFTSMLLNIHTVTASENHSEIKKDDLEKTKRHRYTQPISYVERGVEFFIFPDGSFDFNTNVNNTQFNRNSRRSTINTVYNSPRINVSYSSLPARTYVFHDRNGTIRSIGDLYINYDKYGKVTRIGSIYMDYGRGKHATLIQVGALKVNYNHWGEIVNLRGQVNRFNNNCNICGSITCNVNHAHTNAGYSIGWNDTHYENDDNYYYYKQNGKVKKHKKNK